jgi:hypothetical protein
MNAQLIDRYLRHNNYQGNGSNMLDYLDRSRRSFRYLVIGIPIFIGSLALFWFLNQTASMNALLESILFQVALVLCLVGAILISLGSRLYRKRYRKSGDDYRRTIAGPLRRDVRRFQKVFGRDLLDEQHIFYIAREVKKLVNGSADGHPYHEKYREAAAPFDLPTTADVTNPVLP